MPNQQYEGQLERELQSFIPLNSNQQTIDLFMELFEYLRYDCQTGEIKPQDALGIAQYFASISDSQKDDYLEGYIHNKMEQENDDNPQTYQQTIDAIAQTVPEELRELFYYVTYKEALGEELEPEVIQLLEDIKKQGPDALIQQSKLADALDKKNTLDVEKSGRQFNKPLTSEHIRQMLASRQ